MNTLILKVVNSHYNFLQAVMSTIAITVHEIILNCYLSYSTVHAVFYGVCTTILHRKELHEL